MCSGHPAPRFFSLLVSIVCLAATSGAAQPDGRHGYRFEISIPRSLSTTAVTGRVFLAFARSGDPEPRLQVGRYGVPFFGVDVEGLAPEDPAVIDASTLGYPVACLADLPEGKYFVQAVFSRYTRFDRSDGHSVWMHMDRWEGQDWRKSPGNLVSEVNEVTIVDGDSATVSVSLTRELSPIDLPEDTKWVKRIRMQSDVLSEFWGRPIFIGATVLLPRGYDDHPDVHYPTVYEQGHFSLAAPFRFELGNDFADAWMSDAFPRFLAITIQHPTPYFDDSYAVNSANNGPYGDAIHNELIPEIERRFRAIPEPYARVLTGGSTGGWEAFALQVFYPDFYGGTWAFSPDPLDFRNVEGINIYEDENAFYKQYEWYRVPTTNTRDSETGTARLTQRQRNTMELVNGTRGRSGEQLDIWSAVFGPVGDDGYFKPLFDKRTGAIDSTVADYWREHYDLRHILQRDWKVLGPKLKGKLHLIVGRLDDFYLNWGVYYLKEFLDTTNDPYYEGSFTFGDRGGHQWRPYPSEELIRIMGDHVERAQPGDSKPGWRY